MISSPRVCRSSSAGMSDSFVTPLAAEIMRATYFLPMMRTY
jgi:hypothetical protein